MSFGVSPVNYSGSSPTNDRIFIIISYVPYSFSVVFNYLIYFGQFVYVFMSVCLSLSLSLSLSLVGRVILEVDDQCDKVVLESHYVAGYGA